MPTYEIYKDYNGDAPDTESFFQFDNEEEAKKAVELLTRIEKTTGECVLGMEGYESRAKWKYRVFKPEKGSYRDFLEMLQDTYDSEAILKITEEELQR